MTKIRTGQAPKPLTRAQFQERFKVRFYDPAFDGEQEAIAGLEAIAWKALQDGRKAPITRPAGRGFADPNYEEVSVQWMDTQQGWDYPKHLAGRAYGVVVHGDVAGVEAHRRNLTDWLEWMGLIDAGAASKLDRHIGYCEPDYHSQDALDKGSTPRPRCICRHRARRLRDRPDQAAPESRRAGARRSQIPGHRCVSQAGLPAVQGTGERAGDQPACNP